MGHQRIASSAPRQKAIAAAAEPSVIKEYGPGPQGALFHERKTSFVYSWQTLATDPCNGRVFCPLLAVAAHKERLAFCKSYARFLLFISAIPPLRVFIAASLSFCITLLAVPSPRPASSAGLHAVHPRQSGDVSLSFTLPSAVTDTRPFFWQNGQPLLVPCFPALLVKKHLFAPRWNALLVF